MNKNYHYLIISNHSIFQKKVLAELEGTGLTSGQPKILDFFKELKGVREGTIFAALVVGMIARFFSRHLGFLKDVLFKGESAIEDKGTEETNGIVITIGREYGL